jgi:hypothetical protein
MTKKLIVPKENFQDMNVYDPQYQIRYRLISDDRNRVSAWTPIFSVDPEVVFVRGTLQIPGNIQIEKNSGYVTVTWDSVSIYKDIDSSLNYVGELPYYDLWIRWAGSGGGTPSNWIYQSRISSTSVNLVVPATYPNPVSPFNNVVPRYLYVEVYRPGNPILRYEQVKDLIQNTATVSTANDTITFPEGHMFSTGTPITYVSATPIGGLTSGATYYVRALNYHQISLYPTRADSQANTNKINFINTPTGTATLTGFPFRMYEISITTL